MERIKITVDSAPVDAALKDLLDRVRNLGILNIYKDFYTYFRDRTIDRYLEAATETPFAPASIGKRRPSGDIITENSLFGIDTEALFNDLTQNVLIRDEGLYVWSDLPYARYIHRKFEEKGPFAPQGVLFVKEDDIEKLEEIILERYEEGFGELPDWEFYD